MKTKETREPWSAPDPRLRSLLDEAFPAAEPDDALRKRILSLAAGEPGTTAPRPKLWWPGRFVPAGMALAAAAILAVSLIVVPRLEAAQVYRTMGRAVAGVQTAQFTFRSFGPEGAEVEHTLWYDRGRWRRESNNGAFVEICAEGRRWTYDRTGSGMVQRGDRPAGLESLTDFSLNALLASVREDPGQLGVRLRGDINSDGRRLRCLEVEHRRDGEPESRTFIQIDAVTDLPVRWDTRRLREGAWVHTEHAEARFGQPVPQRLFTPEASRRWVDLDRLATRWEARLATPALQAAQSGAGWVLRDLQVNEEGAVFVLCTDERSEASGRDWTAELEDDRGTVYVPADGEYPYAPGVLETEGRCSGLFVGGMPVQGRWWLPLEPQQPWHPRQFTLTFRTDASQPVGKGELLARFRVPVSAPSAEVAPEYLPAFARAPGGNRPRWAIQSWSAHLRAQYAAQSGRDDLAERWLRREIALAQEAEQASGSEVSTIDPWWRLYQLYRDGGRPQEARAALEEVRSQTRRWGGATPDMEQEFRSQGL